MRKAILVIGILLEMLVLGALYDTHRKIKTGGDIVHFQVEAPVKINNEERMYSAGTYVMTRDGLVRLSWYWVYQYWYVTVPLPLVLVLLLWLISSRRPAETQPS